MLNSNIKLERNCEGVFSGLRICGVLEDPLFNESYFFIRLNSNVTLGQLLIDLPAITTKRKKVLEALKEIIYPELISIPKAQIIVSAQLISETCELSLQTVEQVFKHYSENNFLTFDKIVSTKFESYVILKHNFLELQKEVTKYIAARNHFSHSLQELEKLSTATTCRLSSSFDFFSPRSLQGGSKKSYFCMQCDLCTKRIKGTQKNAN